MMKTETNITPAPDDSGKYGKDATGGLPMRYFYHVHAVGGEKAEISFFLLINGNNTEITKLTAEMLQNSDEYRQFTEQHNPKRVIADYTVYGTQEDIGSVCASERGEYFRMLIDTKKAEIATSSELDIDYRQKAKKSGGKNGKNRKIKLTPAVIAIGGGVTERAFYPKIFLGKDSRTILKNWQNCCKTRNFYKKQLLIYPGFACAINRIRTSCVFIIITRRTYFVYVKIEKQQKQVKKRNTLEEKTEVIKSMLE